MSFLLLFLLAGVYQDTPITRNLDSRWQPGTYAEYRAEQPEWTGLRVSPVFGETRGTDVVIAFEEHMTDSLDEAILNQWYADIASEGNTVSAVEISYAWPEEIREWLQGLHADGLKGVVFVGDIPCAWACTEMNFRYVETFPSDYFYMDLDGVWEDNWIGYPGQGVAGQDTVYDSWSGDLFPEIYTSRILTSVLLDGNEYDLVEAYLERLHQWRLNGDSNPRALCYVDDDWASSGHGFRLAMEKLYYDVELVNNVDSTNGTDYRNNRLQEGYTWISPFVHSGPTMHQWSPGPNTNSGHIWSDQPPSRFYNLFACSNCRFTKDWCMGCTYTFGTATGIASVGSTKSGAMLFFDEFYAPLGEGASLGEAYQAWWSYIAEEGLSSMEQYWHLGMVVLGDATTVPVMHFLGMEEDPSPSVPVILLDENPSRGSVVISAPGSFAVMDMSGRVIASGTGTGTLTGLETGIYMVRAEENGIAATEKLCVIR